MMHLNQLLAQADKTAGAGETSSRLTAVRDQALQFVQENGMEFATNLLVAALIFFIGRMVASMLTGVIRRMLQRHKVDEMLVRFLADVTKALLLVVVVMAALEQLGVRTTSLTAILAAAGFAVGMALQGSLGNFAAGVMLILFRPFKVGDSIEAGGTAGIVEELQVFSTVLRTPDNRKIIVPNGQITSANITNNSAQNTRRIDLQVGCGYGDDLLAVKSFLHQVLDEEPRILDEPEPVVAVSDLGESSVNLVVRPWVQSSDYFAVKCDLVERIKLGFDQRGFSFPYPSRDVYMHTS